MLEEIIAKAAIKLNLPYDYVWKIYKAYWIYIRKYISEQPIKNIKTEEEFKQLQPNVNIPSLGKFYLEWERIQNKKQRNERNKNKKTKTTVHHSNNNS